MLQVHHRGLIEAEVGAYRWNDHGEARQTSAEEGKGLLQKLGNLRILLRFKLRQQGIDGVLIFRSQPAVLNNLLNLRLDVWLIGDGRKQRVRDIDHLKLRGHVKAQVAQHGLVHLVGLHINHDLGTRQV